jgi:hypothetical protein
MPYCGVVRNDRRLWLCTNLESDRHTKQLNRLASIHRNQICPGLVCGTVERKDGHHRVSMHLLLVILILTFGTHYHMNLTQTCGGYPHLTTPAGVPRNKSMCANHCDSHNDNRSFLLPPGDNEYGSFLTPRLPSETLQNGSYYNITWSEGMRSASLFLRCEKPRFELMIQDSG